MDIFFIYLVKALILPPAILLILAIISLFRHLKNQNHGIGLAMSCLVGLYLLSLPSVSVLLASIQQTYPALSKTQIQNTDAQAIVVLGGGTRPPAPEYDNHPVLHERVFVRLRYAVKIAKTTKLPLLVSGGKVFERKYPSEAELMQEALVQDFQYKAKWLEEKSRNTAENAQFSYAILGKKNIRKILLVTHALHMSRAVQQFRRVGFQVTPAPTAFITPENGSVFSYIPSASALETSSMALHELLGKLWYAFRY